ncbi:hypothetical protein CB1_000160003 [Camelus ferus]|nr:hypothetical protein CB1_000160003 [Camelus ferus]
MLQQLLITLPTDTSTWVKLHHPEKAKEGPPLWEDVTKMFEGEGYQLSKPSVISQLEKGEEPWMTEKEGPGDLSSDLKSKTETSASTAKNDILQKQLNHGTMMGKFMRDDVMYSTWRKVSKYDDELERHHDTPERDARQPILTHKRRGQETDKFGKNIVSSDVVIEQKHRPDYIKYVT